VAGNRARIFDEFEQVQGPLQTTAKGTGLGLPVSRRLAALLGGELDVQSQPGVGSTFTLSIPLANPDAEPETRISPADDGQPVPLAEQAGHNTALLIDDDEVERYVAAHILRSLGLLVTEAQDGTSGLRSACEQPPDVIVLDLRMPGIDGFGVLEELQGDPATAGIPVIIQTAKPITALERKRLHLAAAVLDKRDSSQGELKAVLEHLLEDPPRV
jgi:CheY-like chemotaxis protein